jgi:hypothetical protein
MPKLIAAVQREKRPFIQDAANDPTPMTELREMLLKKSTEDFV